MKKQTTAQADKGLPSGLRRFLYLTAALTGAAVMIIEILGAKMLAPFFGTSHFVWTAQIAVTLLALAAGYYVGGRLADRSPRPARLFAAILIAGLYLCMITLVIKPVAYWSLTFNLALGSLFASMILFFVPLALLAMTAPFLIRIMTSSVAGVGSNVGRLTAVGTMGSFVGTALIGYVLIPYLPNSYTMMLTAGMLLVFSSLYFGIWGRKRGRRPTVIVSALVGSSLIWLGVAQEGRLDLADFIELHRRNSNFGLLQVIEHKSGQIRYLLNDYLLQNTYDPKEKLSVSTFTYMLYGLARAYTPQIGSALVIGLGIGVVPSQIAAGGVRVDVVDFEDGRHFVNWASTRYDTIILDAFLGDSSPSHLMSREAFVAMRRLLNPSGTLVINCFAEFNSRRDFFGSSLHKTLRSVFRSVRIHSSGSGNVYFVASDRESLEVLQPPDFSKAHYAVQEQARLAFAGVLQGDSDRGIVLTDDYNPVEFYDAENREAFRREGSFCPSRRIPSRQALFRRNDIVRAKRTVS
ncbi:MAG: fused MFS/spermidine synthase [Deltaproteobacteria bacterium]|nr:fused MFS/spermidine synthase [Deltaproteobacteria bacterium]